MPSYYEFEVSLRGVEPKIWRRFQLRTDASFLDLHFAIQVACGWENGHLFSFHTLKHRSIAGGDPDGGWIEGYPDAGEIQLASFFSGAPRCLYEYDFGDSWLHDVRRKRTINVPEHFVQRLLDGARAFPPEDCGGLWGYEECVRVADGGAEGDDPDGRSEWLGDWDPGQFDLDQTRKAFDR